MRHAFEVRLSSQRSSRDRRAKMAATNSLGRSRRGDDMVGYVHKSRCPRLARDRSAFISTGLWYLASVSNTWCRCVDDVARSKAAASNGQQQPSRRTRSSDLPTATALSCMPAPPFTNAHACKLRTHVEITQIAHSIQRHPRYVPITGTDVQSDKITQSTEHSKCRPSLSTTI